MSTVSPYAAPGVGMTTTGNPATGQNSDTTSAPIMSGRSGQLLVSETRGVFGEMAHRGGTFYGSSAITAVSVPILTTTAASVFALYNPLGSNVMVEPIDFDLNILAAQAANVNMIGWSFVNSVANAVSAITKITGPTGAAQNSGRLNGPVPQAQLCSAITFASALTAAANFGFGMFTLPVSYLPTATLNIGPFHYVFNGRIQLPPGWVMTLVATQAATGATTVIPAMSWAEYQV